MEKETDAEFMASSGHVVGGTWYPRVTRIVDVKSKPSLYRFYGDIASYAEGERIKEQSALEGTLVHETAEQLFSGTLSSVPDAIAPSIDALQAFLAKTPVSILREHIERKLINGREKYAGTCDALATINGKFGVLDFKTGVEAYRDYRLQTSAYMGALIGEFPDLSTRWILRIDQSRPCLKCAARLRSKGGRDKVRIPYDPSKPYLYGKAKSCQHEWGAMEGEAELTEFDNWEYDYNTFLALKRVWEWENYDVLERIGYLHSYKGQY